MMAISSRTSFGCKPRRRSRSRDRIEFVLDFLSCLQQRFGGWADVLFILVQCRQKAAALVLEIIETQKRGHAGKVMGMNCAFGRVAFYRSEASKELPFETLYCRVALRLADQLPETGEFGSVENGPN
jgi:hypothetical protein